VPGDDMRTLLESHGPLTDWPHFAASWNDLHIDAYMADQGRYRKRRYAVYSAPLQGDVRREDHQPHYQALSYNHLNGGIERWFEPILPATSNSQSLQTIFKFCRALFSGLGGPGPWHIETHQFRIEAHSDEKGEPTPEGMHRDGVDYVLVLLIHRENIQSGITTIEDTARGHQTSFTLTHPLDAALINDGRVIHGVTAVTPMDPTRPAYRDVLVVTFRKQQEAAVHRQ